MRQRGHRTGVLAGEPLVTCIMPTYERRHFLPAAIRCFLRQDYTHRELIIVDDGADGVGDLLQRHKHIRYMRLSHRTPIGTKRNLACEQAAGELIAHFDDDDWQAAWRLRYQVKELLASGAQVCGLRELRYYDQCRNQAWIYVYPPQHGPWLAGNTLLYTKEFWRQNRFPDIHIGEDTLFVQGARAEQVLALNNTTFCIGIIHDANVSPKEIEPSRWHMCPLDDIQHIVGEDWPLHPRPH